jgi:hypothetical protein
MLFGFNGRATRNFLILLVSMHYILFIDRVNLAAAAPVMQQDLGLSNLALGLAFSAFNYSYAPFQLVGAGLPTADRFGARRTLTRLLHSVLRAGGGTVIGSTRVHLLQHGRSFGFPARAGIDPPLPPMRRRARLAPANGRSTAPPHSIAPPIWS